AALAICGSLAWLQSSLARLALAGARLGAARAVASLDVAPVACSISRVASALLGFATPIARARLGRAAIALAVHTAYPAAVVAIALVAIAAVAVAIVPVVATAPPIGPGRGTSNAGVATAAVVHVAAVVAVHDHAR